MTFWLNNLCTLRPEICEFSGRLFLLFTVFWFPFEYSLPVPNRSESIYVAHVRNRCVMLALIFDVFSPRFWPIFRCWARHLQFASQRPNSVASGSISYWSSHRRIHAAHECTSSNTVISNVISMTIIRDFRRNQKHWMAEMCPFGLAH